MRFGAENRTTLVLLIALLLNLVTCACSQTKGGKLELAKQHKEKALNLRYEGDIQGAIKEQLKAVELDDKNVELLSNLAGFYLDANEVEKAKQTAEKVVKLDSNSAWGHFLQAESLLKSGETKGALSEYLKAFELQPQNAMFAVSVGALYSELDDKKNEKKYYVKALEINPNYTAAIYNLALLEEEEGNTEKAIYLYEKVLNLEKEDKEMLRRAREKLEILKSKKSNKL